MDPNISFWHYVTRTSTCWLWTGGLFKNGYGKLNNMGRTAYAHRVSWELTLGPIPPGENILHTCDVPRCVRPDHLYCGSQTDNLIDAVSRHRHNTAKLTPADVREIRNQHPHTSVSSIARQFPHMSRAAIWDAAVGRSWKHVV